MRSVGFILATVASLLIGSEAHIEFSPNLAKPGSVLNTALGVGHGCDGSPTTGVNVTVPEEVVVIVPANIENWTLNSVYRPLNQPQEINGQMVNESISSFSYTGGSIDAHTYFGFNLTITIPDISLSGNENATLYFPTVQTCVNGSTSWNSTDHSVAGGHPAPNIVITNNLENPAANDESSASSIFKLSAVAAASGLAAGCYLFSNII